MTYDAFEQIPAAIRQGASLTQWQDAKWQMKHCFTLPQQFESVLCLSEEERAALHEAGKRLALRVTPYFMSLIDPHDAQDALRLQVIPRRQELEADSCGMRDPLNEQQHAVCEGLVHRYPDRVLLLCTDSCASYCRYCTRARLVSATQARGLNPDFKAALGYIRAHPQIRDVLLSGGDPLLLSDASLHYLLKALHEIEHVEILRIGTRVPIMLPQRITPELAQMLAQFSPLFLSIHCNHAREITPESARALNCLADAGLPLGSQTVLLRGVNDSIETQKSLYHALLRCRVRPYYLYQCDLVEGSHHFRTPVAKGLRLMEGLYGHTSGYAIPQFVIDAPGGGGKIPLTPTTVLGEVDGMLRLKNYLGESYFYPAR